MSRKIRRAILSVGKSGGKRGGSSTFRVTLPTTWVRQMGLSEEVRNIKLFFDGEQIIIKNNEEEIKMLEKLLKKALQEVEVEMNRVGFIDDSDDMPERFIDGLAKELVENELVPDKSDIELYYEKEGEIEELAEKLLDMIKEKIMSEYNSYSSGGRYCYYKDKKDLITWCLTWLSAEAMSIKEEYKWFMDEFGDIEITLEEYARLAWNIESDELEDYLRE